MRWLSLGFVCSNNQRFSIVFKLILCFDLLPHKRIIKYHQEVDSRVGRVSKNSPADQICCFNLL